MTATFCTPPFHRLRPIRPPVRRHSFRATVPSPATAPLVIGLNQYSHDASIALLDARGRVRFAVAKERLTRRKHDAGHLSHLVQHALSALAEQDDQTLHHVLQRVQFVIANNHHFPIAPFESRLPLQVALNYIPSAYLSPWNLIGSDAPFVKHPLAPHAPKVELSHHLAHAFSAVHAAPFDTGLVLVMDGMGDALDEWLKHASSSHNCQYFHEHNTPDVCTDAPYFRQFPADVHSRPGVSFREAETAYVFRRDSRFPHTVTFTRVFKRWTAENAPPELANHSFEEMESVGAMYSRISAIIFKDWNACGKVMGLAPWADQRHKNDASSSDKYFFEGNLIDGTLSVERGQMKGLEHVDHLISDPDCSKEIRAHFEDLAWHIQSDLETIVSSFVSQLLALTGETNVVFAGGVALNSTVNGVLKSNKQIENFYVPPYPGDEGIAIGCAAFGLSHLLKQAETQNAARGTIDYMPYFGKNYSTDDIMKALEQFEPWIEWKHTNEIEETAQMLSESKVVAWFRGRSEFGARALGNRSILADPRSKSMLDHVNSIVKKRESFRPFAPSVLAEAVPEWFSGCKSDASPFMSLTTKSNKASSIEAVVHVDGTSRLQTLSQAHNEDYYEMISHFEKLTGVPMVLNTSFNVAGEPIVESPSDAISTFLNADGIDALVFPGIVVEKMDYSTLVKTNTVSTACVSFHSHQLQDDCGMSLKTSVTYLPRLYADDDALGDDTAVERTVSLTDSLELEILEVIHGRERCAVSEILELCSSDCDVEAPTEEDVLDRISNLYRHQLILVD